MCEGCLFTGWSSLLNGYQNVTAMSLTAVTSLSLSPRQRRIQVIHPACSTVVVLAKPSPNRPHFSVFPRQITTPGQYGRSSWFHEAHASCFPLSGSLLLFERWSPSITHELTVFETKHNRKFVSEQSLTAKLDGRKFFDFGFGNSTGWHDVSVERSLDDAGSTSDGVLRCIVFRFFAFFCAMPLMNCTGWKC